MSAYNRGDYVKVDFQDEDSGVGEWIWMRVSRCETRLRHAREPAAQRLRRPGRSGSELAVSFVQIREHMKPTER